MLPNPKPTFAGFVAWFPAITGIPLTVIPADSQWLAWGYGTSINTVNPQIAQVPGPFYLQAVYNLAADWVLNWAPDPDPPVPYPTKNRYNLPYMAFLRKQWNLGGFTPGVVQSTADESTSESLVVPEQLKGLTIDQLGNLKTPYGRAYLGIAQKAGNIWGIS
jgi:hypothetical protein